MENPTNPNEPAFACSDNGNETTTTWQGQKGLTKREYFAAKALEGFLSNGYCIPNKEGYEYSANMAVKVADALIKRLNEPTTDEPAS